MITLSANLFHEAVELKNLQGKVGGKKNEAYELVQ